MSADGDLARCGLACLTLVRAVRESPLAAVIDQSILRGCDPAILVAAFGCHLMHADLDMQRTPISCADHGAVIGD